MMTTRLTKMFLPIQRTQLNGTLSHARIIKEIFEVFKEDDKSKAFEEVASDTDNGSDKTDKFDEDLCCVVWKDGTTVVD